MKPGTKVKIKIDTWMAPAESTGVVHDKNLTVGLISVEYDENCGQGIFDFAPEHLECLCPCGSESSAGCSQAGCPLWLKEESNRGQR